jgi:hypothetical protein
MDAPAHRAALGETRDDGAVTAGGAVDLGTTVNAALPRSHSPKLMRELS